MVIGIDASRAFINDKTGTENYSFHLINAILRLPESKSHIFVLFIRPNAIIPPELGGYSNVIVKEIKMKYLWTQLGLAWETYQKFEIRNSKFELDVLWVPAHTLPVLRNPRVKTVVTIHGLEYQWLPEYKNLLQRWYLPLSTFYAAKYADKLIAVSKFTASKLIKELHTSAKKIKVIWEGTVIHTPGVLAKYGIQNKKYILFVGTIQPRKNLVALIEAFAKSSLEKLVIAGGVGWSCEEILSSPAKYNVQERVVFTGRVSESELRELYLGAALYVQPSITEGFGLPVLEAMVAGVPVVSSDGGALSEIVGEAGVIVKFSNLKFSNSQIDSGFVKRLAGAMKRVIGDKKLQKTLIAMGYERVKMFSWDKAAKQTLAVLLGEGYNTDLV